MIENNLSETEERIRRSGNLSEEKKNELLELIARLRSELDQVSPEQRASIQERLTREKEEADAHNPVDEIAASVVDFEKSHPKLVEVVNRICVALSNLGI